MYSRHNWSGGTSFSITDGPGGPFIPGTDGPGGPLTRGTVSSMTGRKGIRCVCQHLIFFQVSSLRSEVWLVSFPDPTLSRVGVGSGTETKVWPGSRRGYIDQTALGVNFFGRTFDLRRLQGQRSHSVRLTLC